MTDWDRVLDIRSHFDPHYAANEEQQKALFDVVTTLKYRQLVVELGVCNGQTAAVLAYAAKLVDAFYIGVDNFSLENSAQNIRTKLFDLDLLSNGTIVEDNTQSNGSWPLKNSISLLFIDAGHDEANVRLDCKLWIPRIAISGVVAFHDYDDPYDPESAHWAVRFYADKSCAAPNWEKMESPKGMAMFRRMA